MEQSALLFWIMVEPPPAKKRTVIDDALHAGDPVLRAHAAVDALLIGFLGHLKCIANPEEKTSDTGGLKSADVIVNVEERVPLEKCIAELNTSMRSLPGVQRSRAQQIARLDELTTQIQKNKETLTSILAAANEQVSQSRTVVRALAEQLYTNGELKNRQESGGLQTSADTHSMMTGKDKKTERLP